MMQPGLFFGQVILEGGPAGYVQWRADSVLAVDGREHSERKVWPLVRLSIIARSWASGKGTMREPSQNRRPLDRDGQSPQNKKPHTAPIRSMQHVQRRVVDIGDGPVISEQSVGRTTRRRRRKNGFPQFRRAAGRPRRQIFGGT